MNQTVQIQFADKMVSFDTFLSAVRNVVQEEISKAVGKRQFITQAKAFDTFGRRNVERWVKEGKVKVFGRARTARLLATNTDCPSWKPVPVKFKTIYIPHRKFYF